MNKELILPVFTVCTFLFFGLVSGQDVAGDWILVMYGGESGGNHYADYSEITFNANGTGTYRDSLASEDNKGSGEFDWTWSSDGIMELSENDTPLVSLYFKDDLKIFTVSEPAEVEGALGIGIKKSSGHTNSDLDGKFMMMDYFWHENQDGFQRGSRGWMKFNGDGTGLWEGIATSYFSLDTSAFFYSISDDGTLTIDSFRFGVVNEANDIFSVITLAPGTFGIGVGVKSVTGHTIADVEGDFAYTQTRGEGGFGVHPLTQEALYFGMRMTGTNDLEIIWTDSLHSDILGETIENVIFVEDDGTFDFGGDTTHFGMLSPDNNFIAEVDVYSIDSISVALGFFMKYYQSPTGIADGQENIPSTISLEQNYPNPFNPSTSITYTIQQPGYVRLNIYDLSGRLVAKLVDEQKNAGTFNLNWNGTDHFGKQVSSGSYYMILKLNGNASVSRKMLLLK